MGATHGSADVSLVCCALTVRCPYFFGHTETLKVKLALLSL